MPDRYAVYTIRDMIRGGYPSFHFPIEHCVILLYTNGGGGGANTKVPDMYGVGGGVFSGPKTQK